MKIGVSWCIFLAFVSSGMANNTTYIPECVANDDCEADRVCAKQKCVNPCVAVCGANTVCQVTSHVAMCSCTPGYSGHPAIGCSSAPATTNCSLATPGRKMFYVESSKKADWHGALMNCLFNKTQLAAVETYEELMDIRKLINEAGKRINEVWVSGSDHGLEGHFIWTSTGKPIPPSSNLWLPGQPNNGNRIEQDCVKLLESSKNKGFGLNDENCQKKTYFVCQYYV